MELSKFLKIITPIIKCSKETEAVRMIFESASDNKEYIDYIYDLEETTYRKILRDDHFVTRKMSIYIIRYFNKKKFEGMFLNINEEAKKNIIQKLKKEVNMTNGKFEEELADLFYSIIYDMEVYSWDSTYFRNKNFNKIEKCLMKEAIKKMKNLISYKINNKLLYKSVTISQKLNKEYNNLIKIVKKDVVDYYKEINKEIKSMENNNIIDSDKIRKIVREEYEILKKRNLSQDIVYDEMINWFKKQLNISNYIAQRLVAYFIQSCEVFDAISK